MKAAETESDWRGRPPLTSFPDHLGQVKKMAKKLLSEFKDAITPHFYFI